MALRTILAASVLTLAGLSASHAADAIVSQDPSPIAMPSFSWSSAYVGGQIGYAWGKSDFSNDAGNARLKPNGFLGGVYAGYNFALNNNVVLGIDGDVTYNDLSEKVDIIDADNFTVGEFENKVRWSGAVRARAGYAVDRFLPYIAGGVAFANVKSAGNLYDRNFSESKTLTGWTLGAGVDYAATDNLIVRLEYRYTDYGHKDFSYDGAVFRDKLKTNDIRLGVAYKF